MAEVNARKRNGKWEYRFEAAKIGGSRQQISKSGFSTKKEALAAGTKAMTEYNNAGLHFVPSEISFSDYLDFWMNEYCLINLKPNTVINYQKKIKLHIKPALGTYKLKAITPAILQTFINRMFNQGYSRNSLAVIKGILSGSMSYAVEPAKFIQNSPMLYVKTPSKRAKPEIETRTEPHVYIPKEKMDEILDRFQKGSSAYLPLTIGYRCGLRCGEAYALLWEDINFQKGTLKVQRQVQWDSEKGVWYFSLPKYDSVRTIEIDSELIELLAEEKDKQEKAREYYAELYTRHFINDRQEINDKGIGKEINLIMIRENGTYITSRTMQHTSAVIHHKLNFPEFDYHSLRHTHATMLAEKGAPPKYVQERLGHKNIQVTLQIYQHLTESISEQGRKILDGMY